MNLNATLVLPVLGEYLIFVNIIHYWFQFFKHFREPPVPVLWGKYEPKNLNTNIVIPVLSRYLILLIIASSSSLNILEPGNCQFWFFGKQFRIKELPVPVISETSTNKWVSGKNC
jgi:hypothetical protein